MRHLLLFLFSLTVAELAAQTDAPVLQFDSIVLHARNIEQGEILRVEFWFKNAGRSPLLISKAAAADAYGHPNWSMEPVPPGMRAKITYAYNTTGKMGPQTKTIEVESNGSNVPFMLQVDFTIVPQDTANAPVLWLPGLVIDFGKIQKNGHADTTITFTNTGKKPLIIRDVIGGWYAYSIVWSQEPVAPGKTGKLRIHFNAAGSDPGFQSKPFIIVSNNRDGDVTLKVSCEVVTE